MRLLKNIITLIESSLKKTLNIYYQTILKLNIHAYFSRYKLYMHLNIIIVTIVANAWEIWMVKIGAFKESGNKTS